MEGNLFYFLLTIKLSLILVFFCQVLSTVSAKVEFIVIKRLKQSAGSKHLLKPYHSLSAIYDLTILAFCCEELHL